MAVGAHRPALVREELGVYAALGLQAEAGAGLAAAAAAALAPPRLRFAPRSCPSSAALHPALDDDDNGAAAAAAAPPRRGWTVAGLRRLAGGSMAP